MVSSKSNVQPATVGQLITLDDPMEDDPLELTVGPKCSSDSAGQWVCVDHPMERLQNNFQKDIHIGSGTHTLAWICLEHGPEVP